MKKNCVTGSRERVFTPLQKMLLTMKLSVFLFLLGIISVQANELFSQTSLSMQMESASVEEVLEEIKQQCDYDFIYDYEYVKELEDVTIEFNRASLDEVLYEVLKNTNLDYRVDDKMIVLFPRNEVKPLPVVKENTETSVQQQKKTIKGKVTDKTGNSLPGVSVIIKGTTTGVATDTDGNYLIEFEDSNPTLVFSFVGMISQEFAYTGQEILNVTLGMDSEQMAEVIVTGYQTVKEERMTGAVEVITAKDLVDTPFSSVDNLISGKLAGVSSFMSSGQAGSNADIRIRGVNTLSGSTQPLWIVDGLPMQGEIPSVSGNTNSLQSDILNNGIGNLAPSDIKSITIIKDAAAAAIYGARAANGVIVITTKKGTPGDLHVSYNGSFSLSMAPSFDLDFMNAAEKVDFEKKLYRDFRDNTSLSRNTYGRVGRILFDVDNGKYTVAQANELMDDLSNRKTDWMDLLFRNSKTQTHSLSLSGGNDKTTTYFSANYTKQEGILKNDSYENFNARLNTTYKFNDKFDVAVGMNASLRNKEYHSSSIDPFKYAIYANPYEKAFNADGSYASDETYLTLERKRGLDEFKFNNFNILNEIDNSHNNSSYWSTTLNAQLNYQIIDGLKLSTKFAATRSTRDSENYALAGTYAAYSRNWLKKFLNRELKPEENQAYFSENASFSNEFSLNNTLEYSKEHGDFYISVLLGQEISRTKSNNLGVFFPEYYKNYEIVGYPNIIDINGSDIALSDFGKRGVAEARYSSFYSAFTVGYKDKYIVNFNARKDGADIIGNNNQFTPLWSTSVRWNLGKEEFVENISFIDDLSLKAQYGFTGNINRNAFPFTLINLSGTDRYRSQLIAGSYTYPNPSIKWEKKKEKGVSLSTSMFNHRFVLDASYYHNTVSDVLGLRRLPNSAGITSQTANVSDILNEGIELSTTITPIKTNDFTLSVGGNISFNKNRLSKAFFNSLDDVKLRQVLGQNRVNVSGYAVGAIFGIKDMGVDPTSGKRKVVATYAQENGEFIKGETFRDQLVLDTDKPVYLGDLNPKYTGGFNLRMSYKNWDLNGNFVFEGGHILPKFSERLSSPITSTSAARYAKLNLMKNKAFRWRKPGDVTDVERYRVEVTDNDKIPLDTDFEDGDYVKMRSLILSYRIPSNLLKKLNLKIDRCKFSVQAENLFTWTKYQGIDPELRRDFGYPIPRNYRLTLNVGF
jgi:TonB-linked SusC/RagA family outer membrane protein